MQCLTFSLVRCRRQIKVIGIQRYHGHNASLSHWPGVEVERLWEYRDINQCLTFSLARCRRQKVMGIQRYHAMPHLPTGQVQMTKGDENTEISINVLPSHWPDAADKQRQWARLGSWLCWPTPGREGHPAMTGTAILSACGSPLQPLSSNQQANQASATTLIPSLLSVLSFSRCCLNN